MDHLRHHILIYSCPGWVCLAALLEGVDDPPTRFGIGVGRMMGQADAGCASSQDGGEFVVLQAG